jgi:16S rRNA (adenine1518-N6/adenine1519-N6)-dimethyltransferase
MLRPKKQFSQNFLVDKKAKARVLNAMSELCNYDDPEYALPIVEIGPGAGDLTEEIVNWKRSVLALELDSEAVEYLEQNLVHPSLKIIQCDAMKVIERGSFGLVDETQHKNIKNPEDINFPNDFILLSALPYQVGSRILVDLAVMFPHVSFGCIHQREVVKKTILSENFSFFGAWLKLFWETEYKFDLAPHCFNPQPKVYSTFFIGKSKNLQTSQLFSTIKSRNNAKETLKKLFSFPSKTLANNLKTLGWSKDKINKFLEDNFENPNNIRLSWQNYEMVLTKIIEQN